MVQFHSECFNHTSAEQQSCSLQGRASQSQKVQDVTLGQLKKSAADIAKCISQAEKEVRLIEQRSSSFDDEMKRLEQDILEAGNNCNNLVARQHALRAELEMLGIEKYKVNLQAA